MNLSTIKNLVTSKTGRQVLKLQKHSPTLLFAAGVVGVVGTVVLASRATLKLDEVLSKAQSDIDHTKYIEAEEYTEEDRQRDRAIIYGRTTVKIVKLYAPAVFLGAVSIMALSGSHIILSRRNVAVTAAYAALDKGFKEYRARVAKEFGVEKEKELLYCMEDVEIVEETKTGPVTKTVKKVGSKSSSIYARYFEESNRNWEPREGLNQLFLSSQQNYANDLLRSRGHIFLNEVYDMLGMERVPEGQAVGWIKDGTGDGYVDFGIFEGNRHEGMRFVMRHNDSILLDFNVDGIIWDKI